MLISFSTQRSPARQKGVVLLITLIMLVAMTLAAIALVRSVDTTNLVSGNLAFQQTSAHAADLGTEQAVAFLYSPTMAAALKCDSTGAAPACPAGYKSRYEMLQAPPTAGITWDNFWTNIKIGTGVRALTNLPDGYSGDFIIEAMCTQNKQAEISPGVSSCASYISTTVVQTPQGQDMGSQQRSFTNTSTTTEMKYYRVTTRIQGPRNSVSYIQTLVAVGAT